MRRKLLVSAVSAVVMLNGCALRDFSHRTMAQDVNDGTTHAIKAFATTPARENPVNNIDEPYLAFRTVKNAPAEGTLTLKASAAPFGPLMMEAAHKAGYSVVFADNVDATRKVTVDFDHADTEEALRETAFLAGYVAAFDKERRTYTVADTATFTFKLPTSVFQQLTAHYEVGGNPVSSNGGGSGGG
ncbi:hypothetical protein F6X40_41315, partial [Paraburkholderia sp. UCT31]|uniref:hypothetical protein n=1 Tax=Paraburkholderia sp. UCT31 TaxID=2615209 RepID=UPI0016561300